MLDCRFAGKSAESFLETFLEIGHVDAAHRRTSRDDEIETGSDLVLVAAEELAQEALAAVAHHRAADGSRCRHAQAGGPAIAAIADPEQEPPAIEPAPGLARGREIGAAADALRRTEEEAALRGVRQR